MLVKGAQETNKSHHPVRPSTGMTPFVQLPQHNPGEVRHSHTSTVLYNTIVVIITAIPYVYVVQNSVI